MRTRTLVLAWLAVGVVVWNGVYDRYISEGAREYLQIVAEVDAGYGRARTLPDVMNWWKHTGAVAASGWAALVAAAGWTTIWVAKKRP